MTVSGNSAFGSSAPHTLSSSGSHGSSVWSQSATQADAQNPFSADQVVEGDFVNLGAAQQGLIMADDNRDGLVDKQELANAAYQLLNNPNATEADIQLGRLYAAMVLGGKDAQGLFPDMNGDGAISANELALLASGDQQDDVISAQDLRFAFGDDFNAGASHFTLSDLEAIASGQSSTVPPETESDTASAAEDAETGTVDTPSAANPEQPSPESTITKVVTAFTELIQAMLNPSDGGQMMNAFMKFFTALIEAFTQPQAQAEQGA
jgi:hypothetical protein